VWLVSVDAVVVTVLVVPSPQSITIFWVPDVLVNVVLIVQVALGDYMEIVWGTPAWGTAPTGVEANAIIYIENNI